MKKILLAAALVATSAAVLPTERPMEPQEVPAWLAFDIDDVRAQRAEHGRPWREFIRVPDLFAGVYEIAAGGEDRQNPHDADEVYYVLSGRAVLTVEADRIPVEAGSVVFVAKDKAHRFVEISEDLSVLVFFATASEGEEAPAGGD